MASGVDTVFGELGKMTVLELVENYAALIEEILRAKPSAAKGRYIKGITLAGTMTPGIKVDPARTRGILEEFAEANDSSEVATVTT